MAKQGGSVDCMVLRSTKATLNHPARCAQVSAGTYRGDCSSCIKSEPIDVGFTQSY